MSEPEPTTDELRDIEAEQTDPSLSELIRRRWTPQPALPESQTPERKDDDE